VGRRSVSDRLGLQRYCRHAGNHRGTVGVLSPSRPRVRGLRLCRRTGGQRGAADAGIRRTGDAAICRRV
ncbi:MAG: hypothetical protein AVDCRST_MAG18-3119, partial [uncultured Thermomicrobiales bacterium]